MGPKTFVSKVWRTMPAVRSNRLALKPPGPSMRMAPLFTRMSQRPNIFLTSATARAGDVSSSTSRLTVVTCRPSPVSCSAAARPLAISRAPSATASPMRASWRTISSPMPRLAPDTRAMRVSAIGVSSVWHLSPPAQCADLILRLRVSSASWHNHVLIGLFRCYITVTVVHTCGLRRVAEPPCINLVINSRSSSRGQSDASK